MPFPFDWIIVSVAGLAVGSFLNVCIYRLPRRQSIVSPGSRCPSCRQALRWYHNVPVVSWVVLGGRCAFCRQPISIRYPLVEAATAALFLLHLAVLGWGPLLVVRLAFAAALVVLFAIDLEHRILPNVITLPGLVIGLAASPFAGPGWISSIAGILIGGGLLWAVAEAYYRWRGIEGLGFGDVKMLAMIGAVLGWQQVLVTLLIASLAGSTVGLILVRLRGQTLQYAMPFGTFLALGAIVASLWGSPLVAWYLSLYPR
jgi:leader peptidase (prepilin peptidase)/N-methyltransferase